MKLFLQTCVIGGVTTLQTEARFLEHHINAYEVDNNTIVADFVTFPDIEAFQSFLMETFHDPKRRDALPLQRYLIKRYTLHLDTRTVDVSEFDSRPGLEFINRFDFPAINEKYRYRRYCVAYGFTIKADGVSYANFKIVKKNVCNTTNDMYWYKPNHYPSEPTFVPRPGSIEEDDGILIDIILDGEKGKSYVGIFDAKTMKLMNKAYLPTVVPFLFHGRLFHIDDY